MKKIIFFGPPGAGKGTQAKIISKFLNISHLSTGDILRKKLLDNDDLAKKLQSIMSSGNLVSDDILNSIVSSRLKNETDKGFILDGFPRTVNQAERLDLLLGVNYKIDCVLRIKVYEDEIIKRLIDRGRDDDKPDIIKNRFKSYNLETQPLIPFYEKRNILLNIDGMKEIEEVSLDIKKVLSEF